MEDEAANQLSIQSLFLDFDHPNPFVNEKACLGMVKYFPDKSMQILIRNLSNNDLEIRRKSVKALGLFGAKIFLPILNLFNDSDELLTKLCCLKVLIKVKNNFKNTSFPADIMKLIETATKDDSPEMILTSIQLLRQLKEDGLNLLLRASEDSNILRSSAAVTALFEQRDSFIEKHLNDLMINKNTDEFLVFKIKEMIECK
tara:strand:- start:594 stop:1196 length:603 start_codon:yes stop_codon:yes gene_type:complete